MADGIYIYGIIKMSDPQAARDLVRDNPAIPHVSLIPFRDIAAVVSIRPWMRYESLEQEKAVKDLAIHNFVVEKGMERFPIVPVKFGTMLKSKEEVSALLDKGYALLSETLRKMEGHIELDVVARWELPSVLAAISLENEPVKKKQQELAAKGNDVSIEDKIALGATISQAVNAKKAEYQQSMMQSLEPEAEAACAHDLVGDEMVFNAAFLLDKKREDQFYRTIDNLDQKLESRLYFRVVGPLPGYSFATIEVKRFEPAEIEEAKRSLHLSGEMNDQVLREAYHQLAKTSHPDTSNEEEASEFQRIHTAYTMLSDVIEHGRIYPQIYQWRNAWEAV